MISLCFKVPFNAKYAIPHPTPLSNVPLIFSPLFIRYTHAGGFFIFWLYDFMGMTALGLATEAMITFLTPKYMTYFLVPLVSHSRFATQSTRKATDFDICSDHFQCSGLFCSDRSRAVVLQVSPLSSFPNAAELI
jgi:Protein of unknown function (DUF3533)